MSKNNKSGLGKFLLGAGIGVGLGILFAPKSGKETRADLKKKMDDLLEKAKNIKLFFPDWEQSNIRQSHMSPTFHKHKKELRKTKLFNWLITYFYGYMPIT